MKTCWCAALGLLLAHGGRCAPRSVPTQSALAKIRARGELACGVVREEEDYSRTEDHGNRAAFDVDLCKAVAVAVLGPGARLLVRSYPDEPFALGALRTGAVDLVATASLPKAGEEQDLSFSGPVLQDGQGLLVPRSQHTLSVQALADRRICFLTGSAAEGGLHAYAEAHNLSFIWYPFSEAGEMEAALFTGNCDAVTGDLTFLANVRAIDPRRSSEFAVMPQTLRDDPLAVASLADNPGLASVISQTVAWLQAAEQHGQTARNAFQLQRKPAVTAQDQPGEARGLDTPLGLRSGWKAEVLAAVGNYGEIYVRDLGEGTGLGIPRQHAEPAASGTPLPELRVR